MGAWTYMMRKWRTVPLDVISRLESASPATGISLQCTQQVITDILNKVMENVQTKSKYKKLEIP